MTAVERIGHERAERLLGADGAGQAAVGAGDEAGDGVGRVLERLALEQAGEQQVAGLEPQQLLVELGVAEVGQEAAGLELDERGRDEQELGGDVEVEGLHPLDLDEVLVDDRAQRDLEQLDFAAQDEVEQEVERALEDGGSHLVRHRRRGYRGAVSGPRTVDARDVGGRASPRRALARKGRSLRFA